MIFKLRIDGDELAMFLLMINQFIVALTSCFVLLAFTFPTLAQAEIDFSDLPDYSSEVIKHPTCQIEMQESLKTFEIELRLGAKGWAKHEKSENLRMELHFSPIKNVSGKSAGVYHVEGKLFAPAETMESNEAKDFLHVGKDLKSSESASEVNSAFVMDFIKKMPSCKPVLFPDVDN